MTNQMLDGLTGEFNDGKPHHSFQRSRAFLLAWGKWALILNTAVAWIVMWANLARVHLSMGDVDAAILTMVIFLGPLLAGLVWVTTRTFDLR